MSESGRSGSGRGGGGASRRNAQGRERNRGPQRSFTENAPSQRTRRADPARLVAFEVLRAVAAEDAYANLVLPARIRHHGLDKRDAGRFKPRDESRRGVLVPPLVDVDTN